MAEGGVKEKEKTYGVATENMCEICLDDDNFKQASWYCKQCSQRLCDTCKKHHTKVSSTKSHEIIEAFEVYSIRSSEQTEGQLSDECTAHLCRTHNKPLEFYCEDHNVPMCDSCKLVDHKKCKQLQDLHQIATEHKGKYQEVIQHLRAIDAGMDEIREAMEKEQDMMEINKKTAIQKIKQEMKRIEILGKLKIVEVEETFKEENKVLEEETAVVNKSKALVSTSIDELEKSSKTDSEEDLFLATRDAEIQAAKYQDTLIESSFLTHREIQFEVNSKLGSIATFGNITLGKSTVSVKHKSQVIDYLNTDSKRLILWFDMIPNGQLALLIVGTDAKEQSQLRLYSASKYLLSMLNLPPATSAATINEHQIVVAIPKEQHLKVVNTNNDKLEQQRVIKTQGHPLLVSSYSNNSVLIVVNQDKGKFCFQLLDLEGRVQKKSACLTDLQTPVFMKTSADKKTIYITDESNGILGFNLQGDMIFHFTQQSYHNYYGLSVDRNNSLYFRAQTGQGEYALFKISPNGKNVKPVALKFGFCHPLRNAEGKLYLCKKNAQNEYILVYMFI